jgi:hypothetical protein
LKTTFISIFLFFIGISAYAADLGRAPGSGEWTSTRVGGQDGRVYILHHSPDGKAIWTDTFVGPYRNLGNNPPGDLEIRRSQATEVCKDFGENIRLSEVYPGKRISLPTMTDFEDYLLGYFDYRLTAGQVGQPDQHTRGMRLTYQGLVDANAVFPNFTKYWYWSSTIVHKSELWRFVMIGSGYIYFAGNELSGSVRCIIK